MDVKLGDKVFVPSDFYYTPETGYVGFGEIVKRTVVKFTDKTITVKIPNKDRFGARSSMKSYDKSVVSFIKDDIKGIMSDKN